MKKKSSSKSGFINSRNLIAVMFWTAGISLAMLSFNATASSRKTTTKQQTPTNGQAVHGRPSPIVPSAPSPTTGTLTSANIGSAKAINYADSVGSALNLTFFAGSGTCAVPMSCSTYTLTIDPSVGTASAGYDPTQFQIFIEISWAQAAVDYDTWMCSGAGNCVQANVVASNASTTDPETIFLPTSLAPGVYTINAVNTTGAPVPYNGTVYLQPRAQATTCPTCPVPRYQTYYANAPTPNGAGEPSIGVDWNPNVPSLKVTAPGTPAHGPTLQNTGGVAFYQASFNTLRVDFDDCASPAFNNWTDKTPSTLVLSLDPIGFVDHYSPMPLGTSNTPPVTPGRVFNVQLNAGNSEEAFSDNDGNSYTPGEGGSPPAGPDHETLGGGPYSTQGVGGLAPPHPTYANAIYYCSQNIAAEAECSRSDDGGLTFGPGVTIFNPAQCLGSIHGHVKVAPNGTVYVPNASCGAGGAAGVAISLDNGITWNSSGVPGSTGSLDPSAGIGQNSVGKPAGTIPASGNTVYLGWISGDGTPHIAHSKDQGATWLDDTNVGASVVNVDGTTGIRHSVFPAVVAGDDNRAAFGFLGTGPAIDSGGTCDPLGTGNCANIWHAYVATTYDGGANWSTVDTTPNKAVQKGVVCTQGTFCAAGRNLLDFNDFTVDSQGRGLFGYDDGVGPTGNNTFDGQSGGSQATIARQSGGKRLFSFFDIPEPHAPLAPQAVSANRVTSPAGILVKWLEPDSGGATITGYRIYRGTVTGGENTMTPVGTTTGETSTQFLDTTAVVGTNYFYHITALNTSGESAFCNEPGVAVVTGAGDPCSAPFIKVQDAGAASPNVPTDPTMGEMTIEGLNMGEPFTSCADNSVTFRFKVKTMDPGGTGMVTATANGEWQVLFNVMDNSATPTAHTIYVDMDTNGTTPTPEFAYGRRDPSATGGTLDSQVCASGTAGCPMSGSVAADGTIIIKMDLSAAITFTAVTVGGTGPAFTWDPRAAGTLFTSIKADTILLVGGVGTGFLETVQATAGNGAYTRVGNTFCQTGLPLAVLTATPPNPVNVGQTVTFNGSGSHEPTGACGTINSYTLNFGDGTASVTQSTPTGGGFTHAYAASGDYPATLKVKDTSGLTSTTVTDIITVIGTPPPLSRVDSVKTHTGVGQFPVPLQKDALTQPRGVECRTGGANGNHTIVFTFQNNLLSVGSVLVASGPGSVLSSNFGPGLNQYTVNLTGVTNAQYVTVALSDAHDTAGNIGDVATTMGALVGDTTASGAVNSSDIAQTQSHSGQAVTSSDFREDVTVNGLINSSDITLVQSKSGTALPSSP
jgi:hypothetical protein